MHTSHSRFTDTVDVTTSFMILFSNRHRPRIVALHSSWPIVNQFYTSITILFLDNRRHIGSLDQPGEISKFVFHIQSLYNIHVSSNSSPSPFILQSYVYRFENTSVGFRPVNVPSYFKDQVYEHVNLSCRSFIEALKT